jgi:hypothetical protein
VRALRNSTSCRPSSHPSPGVPGEGAGSAARVNQWLHNLDQRVGFRRMSSPFLSAGTCAAADGERWSFCRAHFSRGSREGRWDGSRPTGRQWPEAIHTLRSRGRQSLTKAHFPCPDVSGSGRGQGERSMPSWDGFRYCCEISASELLLKQPEALLHGVYWTADPGTTKCSSPQSLARSPHPTSPSLRRNEDARPAKFNGHMQVPRLSRWVTQ